MSQAWPKPTLIAFDLDGTLVDSAPDLALAINAMLADLKRPAQSLAIIRQWIGNGAPVLVHRALTNTLDEREEPALFKQAHALFIKHYQRYLKHSSQLYPQVYQTLTALQKTGIAMACITNKPAHFTEQLLAKLELTDFFGFVASGDSFKQKKPHPLPLLEAARFFNILPENSLMVGDSINDIEAAKKAGFQSICVDYGYSGADDVYQLGANKVISNVSEVRQYLEKVA